MSLADAQSFIDIKKRVETEQENLSNMCLLRMEIIAYGLVKQAWGLGPIKCKLEKETCNRCMKKHCTIFGYYRNFYDQSIQSVYLGRSYSSAHARMNHVKSFFVKKVFFVFS